MRAGKLDRRINIRSPVVSRNEMGEDIRSFAGAMPVWAEIRPLEGNERFIDQRVQSEVTTLFTIRWRSGITTQNVIDYRGMTYDVLAVLEIGRREGLAINARARET